LVIWYPCIIYIAISKEDKKNDGSFDHDKGKTCYYLKPTKVSKGRIEFLKKLANTTVSEK
jgi:hypothetical protein